MKMKEPWINASTKMFLAMWTDVESKITKDSINPETSQDACKRPQADNMNNVSSLSEHGQI